MILLDSGTFAVLRPCDEIDNFHFKGVGDDLESLNRQVGFTTLDFAHMGPI